MNHDSWQPGNEQWGDPGSDSQDSGEQPFPSLNEQLARGQWPVRLPVQIEIYVEGWTPRFVVVEPGRRRHPSSQVITLVLEYDRARICEMVIESIHERLDSGASVLLDLIGLLHLDRDAFLGTAIGHFARLLREAGKDLLRDPDLPVFVRELHDFDEQLIAEVVMATSRVDRIAGQRLRDVLCELLDCADVREHLGWLTADNITERLSEC